MPLLNPDYDPDWENRFKNLEAEIDRTHQQKDVNALQKVYWAQFRTMAGIRDFHYAELRKQAERQKTMLIIADLSDDCTWEEIGDLYTKAFESIENQVTERSRSPFVHPPELDAFYSAPSIERVTEPYSFATRDARLVCNLTIEYHKLLAHVCLTSINNAGSSVTRVVESLATSVFIERLANRYHPRAVRWYTYLYRPGHLGTEEFDLVTMHWNQYEERYSSADTKWNRFPSVPEFIAGTAEFMGVTAPRPALPIIPRSLR